ncbi:hypothetical protein GS682_18625 [Nostoc sp. B(2019)]|nr:hypothetical protein [Nostoc sp. B(2019)]
MQSQHPNAIKQEIDSNQSANQPNFAKRKVRPNENTVEMRSLSSDALVTLGKEK